MASNEELIFNKLQEVYPSSIKEITELSFNDADNRNFIECTNLGFDFDTVNNANLINNNEKKEKSPDAIFCNNQTLHFVEFKEGKHKKEDIRLKIHESNATLFFFCQKYLPEISRTDFFQLKITFTLIHRVRDNRGTMFTSAMEALVTLHNLGNLDGYIIQKNNVVSFPRSVLNTLRRITGDKQLSINLHQRDGTIVPLA
ncbi:hypothetical protein VXS02_05665 [Photobacterium piscicola]|uniref:hypothetical protein n=1 Tax=Photobacterium piscicola TaxID=1378299 RepID=UPI002E19C9D6|nr:hypothetical protein [Photobacterium piscicola]